MATKSARLLALAAMLGTPLALSGCASPGPIASRHTMLGTLKASVAQLEGDNQTLRRQVAQLKAENTRIEDRLVQEEAANGEMAARLDDAKELISRQGGDSNAMGRGTKSSFDEEIPPPAKTINRSSRRKPPAASIPRLEPFDSDDESPDTETSPKRRGTDLGPQGRRDDENRWLPVARGRDAASRIH